MARHSYRGKRQRIPRDYRHKTHVHRAQGAGCPSRLLSALIVSVAVIVGMITSG